MVTSSQTAKLSLKIYFLETRPQFLLLPVVLSFLGTTMAWFEGFFNAGYAVLAFIGLLLAHISVNVLNDYYDFLSGVDLRTKRTPFSGGSGILPAGLMKPKQAFWFGMTCFLINIPIGIYFVVVSGWALLPLLLVGAFCIVLYTPMILKKHWPEWSPGLGLGTLPVLGAYFVQTGHYSIPALIAAIPSGILVHNLLLLNEFPDAEADKLASKKTLPLTIGPKYAGVIYSSLLIFMYVWIAGWAIAGIMPLFTLISFLTIPFAIIAIRGALHSSDMKQLMPALGNNVLTVLVTQLLLGIGYILATAL
jgi:1,4-dihydroxy-2-naphthoate octaprenyltransferase